MRSVCLLLLALLLLGCDVVPAPPSPLPTATAPPATPTPLFSADEARYLRTVRAQVAAYQPELLTVRSVVATPLPVPTARARIAAVLANDRAWDVQAQRLVAPPRFQALQQRYLAATHEIALYANLEDEIVSTALDTGALQTQADLEFAAGQTDLQEFLSALPSGTGAP